MKKFFADGAWWKKLCSNIHSFIVKYKKNDKAAFFLFTSIFTALISLFLFLKLAEDYYEYGSWPIDTKVYNYFLSIRNEKLNSAAKFITNTGGVASVIILTTAVVAFFYINKKRKESLHFALGIIGVWIFNEGLKAIFKRERPSIDRLLNPSGYSFPSGHAMIFLSFIILLSYYILLNFKNKNKARIITLLLFIYAGLVGMSRVYLGVHYFSDVIGGWLAGILWSSIFIIIHRVLAYKKHVKYNTIK